MIWVLSDRISRTIAETPRDAADPAAATDKPDARDRPIIRAALTHPGTR